MIFNGRNIHPMDIELCIMNAHPAIRQGCVVAFAVEEDDQEKLVVVAEIKAAAMANAATAAAAIAQVLLDQHRLSCKAVVLVKSGSLPKTSSGKLQRVRARALFQDGRLSVIHTLAPDQPAPSGLEIFDRVEEPDPLDDERFTGDIFATRHWLRRLFAKSLHVEPEAIGTATAFSSFGVDSAQAMSLTVRLSKYLGARVAPSTLYEHQTIDALALHLCSQSRHDSGELVTLQSGDPDRAPTLFCLHPVGGSAMAYLGLVEQLPTHIPVCAFNNELDDAADDVARMATRYLREMRQRQASGPYYLLGYSFGGVVAYEMARQLVAEGSEVAGLFMIDTPAPLYGDEDPNPEVHKGDRFSSFLAQAILNHLIPEHLDDDERDRFRQRIEHNQRALASYRIDPADSIGLRIIVFRASREAAYLREAGRHAAFDSPDFGWKQASPRSTIEVRTVPGDHFSVMNQPEALANQLASLLAGEGSMAREEGGDRTGPEQTAAGSNQPEIQEVG
jgi:thioesterase domain-containing protein/acyl carrier protein